ncbi:MAG: hypothetical protein ACOYOA_03610 [Saprospiraceae bacterium]
MRIMKLSASLFMLVFVLLVSACSSSKKSKTAKATPPKAEVKIATPPPPPPPPPAAEEAPPAPKYDYNAKSQPAGVLTPVQDVQLAPMEETEIILSPENIKEPTKEQEEAMRKKLEKESGKKKKG